MRTITTMRRIGALAAACFAASALAASAASASADKPLIATASGSSIKAVGRTFDVGTSSRANCPDDVGPQGCVVQTTMLAVVTPVGKTPHLALVARGTTGMDPGTSERIVVRLTAVGAQELRLRGRVDGRLHLRVTEQTVPHSPNPDTVIDLTRLQSFTVPPLVLTDATRLSRVTLAPGQRLVLRLRGENASTGYGWKVDPLAQNSPMLLLSTRSILSPSCTRGMVGCFSVREVVYQSGG
ncbi:MAG: hypothetical protein JWM98_229, partial [Thermoleophilia bacterium]|nr:hypothetical protein [Thermoleophilia bacterium]